MYDSCCLHDSENHLQDYSQGAGMLDSSIFMLPVSTFFWSALEYEANCSE